MDHFSERRLRMVERDLIRRGIRDPRVLAAMSRVPRHLFVPPGLVESAYADEALPLPDGQTISQPYIVALMLEALALKDSDRLLEVGTGSGYSAAVASELCREVYTLERLPGLAAQAAQTLVTLGYRNVHGRCCDGTLGWPEQGPYNAIVVTAAGPKVPPALLEQLAPHAKLVLPLGIDDQKLVRISDGVTEDLIDVRFVPLVNG